MYCTCIGCNLVDTPFLNLMLCKSEDGRRGAGYQRWWLGGSLKVCRKSPFPGAHKIRGATLSKLDKKPSLRRLWLLNCEKRFTKRIIRCEFFTLNVLQYHVLWRQFVLWPHMTSIQHFAWFLGKSQFSSENFGGWNMKRYDTLTYDINYMVGPVTGGSRMWFQPFTLHPSWPGNSTTLELRPKVTRGEVPRDWLDKFVSWWRWTSR